MTAEARKQESLSIPTSVRAAVDERDSMMCRVCGRYLGERRALHHVLYGGDLQGMGGRRQHNVDEIVTVCWRPGDGDCHALVHSDKKLWQPLLLRAIERPGLTALQLLRVSRRRLRRVR